MRLLWKYIGVNHVIISFQVSGLKFKFIVIYLVIKISKQLDCEPGNIWPLEGDLTSGCECFAIAEVYFECCYTVILCFGLIAFQISYLHVSTLNHSSRSLHQTVDSAGNSRLLIVNRADCFYRNIQGRERRSVLWGCKLEHQPLL